MSSLYVLKDETEGVELLDFPGRTARAMFELVDSTETDCADVAVFDWEYHGYGDAVPTPVFLTAASVEADMKTLIGVFFQLASDRKFGASTVLEWVDRFENTAKYARANPDSKFRSCYFE